MPLGGLVSYAGSSDEDSDTEDQTEQPKASKPLESKEIASGEISDEEEMIPSSTILDTEDENLDNIPGLSSSKSLFESLPSINKSKSLESTETNQNFIDENEDLSTIPKAKSYSQQPDLKAMKPIKKKGPIRIMAPSLIQEEETTKRPFVQPSNSSNKTKSGLLSLLPAPKNSLTSISKPKIEASKPSKPAFVPRSVTKKPQVIKKQVDSDDEETDVPFFTMDSSQTAMDSTALPSGSINVKANPEAFHPRGIKKGSHPSHQFMYNDDDQDDYSSVTAPYPPPMPSSSSTCLEPTAEALERLAGKAAGKRRKGEIETPIIDVNFEDIKPDEREWLTKALTEDDTDKPGPRNTIKGERKRKHQITYLAAMAKEREHELKKQWSESAHNRRAAASKYGF